MTATKAPEPVGFFATLLAHTSAVWWAHYDKLVTALFAALTGWAMVYGTAWIGALPQPSVPKPAQAPATPTPVREDPLAGKLGAIEATLRELLKEATAAREARTRRAPTAPPK